MSTGRERAWDELHAAKPPGWWIGSPSYHPERQKWLLYAYDPTERPRVGLRSREWEVEGPTEEDVVRHMARCLREIAAGRAPSTAEPGVGEAWAYRSHGHDPLVRVVVLKIGVRQPPRVLVRFVDDEFEGLQDWVPPGRLKAPWHQVDAYNEWEKRWDAIVAVSPEPDSAEESAASVVFDLLIDPDVAVLGYNASQGVVKIRDVDA